MTNNIGGSRNKDIGPALVAKEESGDQQRKVRWDRLRNVQEGMSSSFAWSVSRNHTASSTQHQDAKVEGTEGKESTKRNGTTHKPAAVQANQRPLTNKLKYKRISVHNVRMSHP